MSERENLDYYGTCVTRMKKVYELAESFNEVDARWTCKLDRLPAGVVPFMDGLYDSATQTLRAFRPDDYLTVKFDFEAPKPNEMQSQQVQAAWQHIESVLGQILPEDALRSEVLKEFAQAFFEGRPEVGKFVSQVQGETHSGKTTWLMILKTAFPAWCDMLDCSHLCMTGNRSSADAPQPWKMQAMGKRILSFEEPPADAKGQPL
eukprot:3624103-Prymnesium_polylepis.1